MDFLRTNDRNILGPIQVSNLPFVTVDENVSSSSSSSSPSPNATNNFSGFPDMSHVDLSEDISGSVIACAAVTIFIASLFVGARFYTRTKILPVLGKEDWAILISLIFSAATSICMILQCHYALGRHIVTVSRSNATRFSQVGWLTIVFYTLSLWFTKASILLLYIRILTYQWACIASKILLAVVLLFHIFVVVTVLTACIPIQKFWNPFIQGYCHPRGVWWANTYGNIISDFLIFLIPLPIIFTMIVPMRQKIGLYFVFLMGFFVCMVSILRMIFLMKVYTSWDPSFDNVNIAIWTCVELNTAIVSACLTTLKPFATRLFPCLLLSTRKRQNRNDLEDPRQLPPTIGSKPIRGINARLSGFSEFETLSSMVAEEEVRMKDLEAQAAKKAWKEVPEPPLAYIRPADAFSLASTDHITDLGPEVKSADTFEDKR